MYYLKLSLLDGNVVFTSKFFENKSIYEKLEKLLQEGTNSVELKPKYIYIV